MVLDGRNRYMAARDLGIEYPFCEYEGNDPLGFVISKNLKRRHLNESQRAMIAASLAKLTVGRPKAENAPMEIRDDGASAHLPEKSISEQEVKTRGPNAPISEKMEIGAWAPIKSPTQQEAADALQVSRDSVKRARKVQEHGAPELVEAVTSGDVSVKVAAELTALPVEEQVALIKQADPKAGLVTDALVMVIWRRGRPDSLLHHTDSGSQYRSHDYQRLLKTHGIIPSMSGRGNCGACPRAGEARPGGQRDGGNRVQDDQERDDPANQLPDPRNSGSGPWPIHRRLLQSTSATFRSGIQIAGIIRGRNCHNRLKTSPLNLGKPRSTPAIL